MFIVSPAQNKLLVTPVSRLGSKSAPTLTVNIFEDILPHEMSSSNTPSRSVSIQVKAILLKLVVVV